MHSSTPHHHHASPQGAEYVRRAMYKKKGYDANSNSNNKTEKILIHQRRTQSKYLAEKKNTSQLCQSCLNQIIIIISLLSFLRCRHVIMPGHDAKPQPPPPHFQHATTILWINHSIFHII